MPIEGKKKRTPGTSAQATPQVGVIVIVGVNRSMSLDTSPRQCRALRRFTLAAVAASSDQARRQDGGLRSRDISCNFPTKAERAAFPGVDQAN